MDLSTTYKLTKLLSCLFIMKHRGHLLLFLNTRRDQNNDIYFDSYQNTSFLRLKSRFVCPHSRVSREKWLGPSFSCVAGGNSSLHLETAQSA